MDINEIDLLEITTALDKKLEIYKKRDPNSEYNNIKIERVEKLLKEFNKHTGIISWKE